MRWPAMCLQRHQSVREVSDDNACPPLCDPSFGAVHHGRCRARNASFALISGGERAAADPKAADAGAAIDDRDSRSGADAAGSYRATARDTGVQSSCARARFLRSRFLAFDPAAARHRVGEAGNSVRHDLTVYGRFHRSSSVVTSSSVGHASCSSETVSGFTSSSYGRRRHFFLRRSATDDRALPPTLVRRLLR